MAIRNLLRRLHPAGKPRRILIISNKNKSNLAAGFQPKQRGLGLVNRKPILGKCKHTHEAHLRYSACCEFVFSWAQALNPAHDLLKEFMLSESQGDQCVYVQQVSAHGKSVNISFTCWLVSLGAPGPAVNTAKPVRGSMMILAFRRFPRRGRKIIESPSVFTSSASPGRRPSFSRTGRGNTTCPLVEILVSMVRQSYLQAFARAMRINGAIVTIGNDPL